MSRKSRVVIWVQNIAFVVDTQIEDLVEIFISFYPGAYITPKQLQYRTTSVPLSFQSRPNPIWSYRVNLFQSRRVGLIDCASYTGN